MNRRSFLGLLGFLPLGAKALVNPFWFGGGAPASNIPQIDNYKTASVVNTKNITIDRADNIEVGDLLIISVHGGVQNGGGPPSGWTEMWEGTGRGCATNIFWKLATGSEPATETVVASLASDKVAWYIRITGNDSTTPIDVEGAGGNSLSATHDITGATTTQDDCLALYFLGMDLDYTFSVSAGWTQEDEQLVSTNGVSACFGFKEMPTAGATGTATVTPSGTDGGNWIQFAVAPA